MAWATSRTSHTEIPPAGATGVKRFAPLRSTCDPRKVSSPRVRTSGRDRRGRRPVPARSAPERSARQPACWSHTGKPHWGRPSSFIRQPLRASRYPSALIVETWTILDAGGAGRLRHVPGPAVIHGFVQFRVLPSQEHATGGVHNGLDTVHGRPQRGDVGHVTGHHVDVQSLERTSVPGIAQQDARTATPWSTSRRATLLPTSPVAPVTRTRGYCS